MLLQGCERASQPALRAQADPSSEAELREISREWDKHFNSGDAARLAALYAEDAVSMPPNSPTLKGRKALEEDFKAFLSANIARHETTVDQIVREGDIAIEVARYRMTQKPRAGGAEQVETGRHVQTRRKIAGQWKIVVEIWNLDTPLPK